MACFRDIISIGFKNGEPDFRISTEIVDLSPESLNELRAMIPIAIYAAEDMRKNLGPALSAAEAQSNNTKIVRLADRISPTPVSQGDQHGG